MTNIKIAEKLLKLPIKPNQCIDKNSEVCSSKEVIDKMKSFLESIGKKIIGVDREKIISEMDEITKCNENELCINRSKIVVNLVGKELIEENIKNNFMPRGPSHNYNWLSNSNIDDVLEIWVKVFADQHFVHINYQMIDFEETQTDLAKFDIVNEYNEKKMRTFGVIINTDSYKSGVGGIHWFAVFGDFRNDNCYTIEYFNSVPGIEPKEISNWAMKQRHHVSKAMGKQVKYVTVNRLKHQTDTHSCGPYSLYYIWCRLHKIPSRYFCEYEVPSHLMHEFRKHLSRWEF